MFPGNISSLFSMGCTKHGYLLQYALGPYFYKAIIADIDEYYSLSYDETTNNKCIKKLQFLIKFWSKSTNEVAVNHLETFFLRKAKSKILKDCITDAVSNGNLSLKNLVMLSSDGPNVNRAVFIKMQEEILSVRTNKLLNLGTCNIHVSSWNTNKK